METKQRQELQFAVSEEMPPEQALQYTMQFVSPTGYEDPPGEDEDHDKIVATGLGLISDTSPWSRGDHIVAIRKRNGGRLSEREMQLWAMSYRVSVKRLYANARTSDVWAKAQRRSTDKIGYSHHEALNSIKDGDVRLFLIEQAEEEGLTVEEIGALARDAKQGAVAADDSDDEEYADPDRVAADGAVTVYAPASVDFDDESILDEEDDDYASENSLSGLGATAQRKTPGDDGEYDRVADALSGSASAYSWSGDYDQNDNEGFSLASDPISAAEQIKLLCDSGRINEGWVATFVAHLTQIMDD